jgi:TonB family protein
MKKGFITRIIGLSLMLFFIVPAFSQDEVYDVVEKMPRFPGCEEEEMTEEERNACSQQNLLAFVYDQVVYPQEALEQEISGTVVLTFVVNKDGSVSSPAIVKDIGGGCGQEALRVVKLMSDSGIKWIPGEKSGQPVNVKMTLPVRFKVEKPADFQLLGRDSIFVNFDTPPSFKGGNEALQKYLEEKVDMPVMPDDTCIVGYIDVSLLVRTNGEVLVLNISNYSNLPFEYVFEAIYKSHQMYYQWEPAIYKGRKVPAAVEYRVNFLPKSGPCTGKVASLEKARTLANEGLNLYEAEQKEEGLAKLNEAVSLFPENAEFKYLRGQMLIDLQRFDEACPDYRYVRKTLNIPEVDQLSIIICNQP